MSVDIEDNVINSWHRSRTYTMVISLGVDDFGIGHSANQSAITRGATSLFIWEFAPFFPLSASCSVQIGSIFRHVEAMPLV